VLIKNPTVWQRVLHGDVLDLREHVFEELVLLGSDKGAMRYACCGVGDMVKEADGQVSVAPRGCGHRLCPRCGRKRGGKYARRILGWLGWEDHAEVWSLCLTQRIILGEGLPACRARMELKHRKFLRWLTRQGMVAAMSSVHIVWSKEREGWHYHVHVLCEMPSSTVSKESLIAQMFAGGSDVEGDKEQAVRLVCSAGPAITALREDVGAVDFWHESVDVIAKTVQYPVRDMCQGVSTWRLGADPARVRASARVLLLDAKGWKLCRAWGRWRKACPAAKQPVVDGAVGGPAASEAAQPACAAPARMIGGVGRLFWEARRGSAYARQVMKQLEGSVHNSGDFAKRFVAFCRKAWESESLKESGP